MKFKWLTAKLPYSLEAILTVITILSILLAVFNSLIWQLHVLGSYSSKTIVQYPISLLVWCKSMLKIYKIIRINNLFESIIQTIAYLFGRSSLMYYKNGIITSVLLLFRNTKNSDSRAVKIPVQKHRNVYRPNRPNRRSSAVYKNWQYGNTGHVPADLVTQIGMELRNLLEELVFVDPHADFY